jgi:hypothetical protein
MTGECGIRLKEESRFGFQIPDPGTLILLMPCVPLKRSLLKLCIQQLRDTRWLSESHITERSENELGERRLGAFANTAKGGLPP